MTETQPSTQCPTCRAEIGTEARYCPRCGYARTVPGGVSQPPGAGAAAPSSVLLPTRPSTRGLVVTVLVIAVLLVATLPILAVRALFFTPADVVEGYFAALRDRDADAAWSRLDDSSGRAGNPLLAARALRDPGYTPPERATVRKVDIDGDEADVTVGYQLAGAPVTQQLKLESGSGLVDRWRITNGLLPLPLPASALPELLVAGNRVTVGEGAQYDAFPGTYRLALPENPLVELPQVDLVTGQQSPDVTPALRPAAQQEIEKQVRAWLDKCAQSKTAEPPDCPFSYSGYYDVTSIAWQITKYPELRIELGPSLTGTARVDGSGGQAKASGRTSSVFSPTFEDTTSFGVDGAARVNASGEVEFAPAPDE
ncbi:zinc ribbon domain-containing protein [Micromonospora sp. NPDC049559]|uniref:zinc ribbon domain-containing protein n=1 Tax=Micromonospora sp. NPDC049559 TaxID=3155923 RepID=UPI00343B5B37